MSTVLVVDDQDDIRLLLNAALTRRGWSVVEAATGREALSLLHEGASPDLVILDVQMPDLDGWDTLAAIRGAPLASDVPVILCTVRSRAEDVRKAWRLGGDGYVTKPFSLTELAEEIDIVTDRTAAERVAVRLARRTSALDAARQRRSG